MSKERAVVAAMYPSERWAKKVDKMPDTQVHAIYMKLQQQSNRKKEK